MSNGMPLTTVTFDLWQTLILDSPELGRPRGLRRIEGALAALRAAGYQVTQEGLVEASRRCYRRCDAVREMGGDVTFEEQVDIFLEEIDGELPRTVPRETWSAVARSYAESYLEHPPTIDGAADEVLRTLSQRGLRLGLICNTGATPGFTQRSFLAERGLARHFATLVFSDEERLSKPSARIFHLALERLGARPGETVHIGDHPVNDVTGAKRAGLRAIWLRRDGKKTPEVPPDACIDSLAEAAGAVLRLAGVNGASLDTPDGGR